MNIIIYVMTLPTYSEMCIYCITPIAKGLCDTPLVYTLKFNDLHPFLVYTPTPRVYAHPKYIGEDDSLVSTALRFKLDPRNSSGSCFHCTLLHHARMDDIISCQVRIKSLIFFIGDGQL